MTEFYKNLYESNNQNLTFENDTEDIPDVVPEEVEKTIKQMKKGKAPGEDGIAINIFKIGGEQLTKRLAQLFYKCLRQRKIPETGILLL